MANPLFSIIILAKSSQHLLPLCLDTIRSQTEKKLEVILVGTGSLTRLREAALAYPELSIRVCSSEKNVISEMMNAGIRASCGKYLQFLYPEDRFLSQQGLAYLDGLIQEHKDPHLIYSGFLARDPEGPPRAVFFPLDLPTLQKGMFPMASRSSCFLKEALLELGGFDRSFRYRGSFDVICRLFQKKEVKVVCSRRVLTDCEPYEATSREMIGYAAETCRILYRHFGSWHAMRWIFIQDHLNIFRWAARIFKQAFCKGD